MEENRNSNNLKGFRIFKNLVFNLILIIIPLSLIYLFEYSLRKFGYGDDLILFTKSAKHPGYMEINKKVARRYFQDYRASEPSNDIFLANKPDTAYRIFVMGESTVRGYPYKMGTTFSRILNYRLQDAFPHKRIEVINTGLTAINSYTLIDFIDEILAQKPDLILIYSGHNEYYGMLGIGSVENGGNARFLKLLQLKLVRYKTFQLMQNVVKYFTSKIIHGNKNKPESDRSMMETIVFDKAIEYGSGNYYAGVQQFQENLEALLKKVKKSGTPLIISEQICNIHDLKPFKSVTSNKNPRADEIFNKAYKLELNGSYDSARYYYYEAKDLDVIRFRAPEDINKAIHKLGEKYNIPVVPMKQYFENKSPHGLIGYNLITEHLHPNIEGYFLMADAFFNEIRQLKQIDPVWDSSLIKPSSFYRNNWGFTLLDSLAADLTIKILKSDVPFQNHNSVDSFRASFKPKSVEDSLAFLSVSYVNKRLDRMHRDLAIYYSLKGNYLKAYKEYYSLIKWYPYDNPLYFKAYFYLLAAKEYAKATELLGSMPDVDNAFEALFLLGNQYYNLKEFKKSVDILEKAAKLNKPRDIEEIFLTKLYNAYKSLGDGENASKVFERIKSINPNISSPEFLSEEQKFTAPPAIKSLVDEAIKSDKEGNQEKALGIFYKAEKINDCPYINMCIGNILFSRQDINALGYLEKVYNENPNNPELLDKLLIIYLNEKKFQKALEMLIRFRLLSNDAKKIIGYYESIEMSMADYIDSKRN